MNKGLLVLLVMTMLSGIVLSSSIVTADNDSVVDEINITVPVACTISGIGMNTHNATINNGQYDSAIGETTIKALCNDNEGFAIYTIGYTDDTDGVNVLTSSTLGTTFDITTGTQTSGVDSKWAMKLTADSGQTYPIVIENSFNNFHNVPDDYTLVASRASGTDVGTSAIGSTITTTYQAYISSTQPAGTYTGQVKYTLVHPNDADAPEKPFMCPANTICYHPNGDDVVGSMDVLLNGGSYYDYYGYGDDIGRQPVTSSSWMQLVSSNYSRAGYGFAGWNTEPDGTGTNYGPNQMINPGNLPRRGLNLYAKWVQAEDNVTMQSFDDSVQPYASAAIGTVIGLTDARDNNVYAVAKQVDGKWWMMENLRLDPGTANITLSNTNNPTLSFLSSLSNVSSTDVWCGDASDENCTDRVVYNTANLDRSLDADGNIHYDENWEFANASWYSYGVYYNWYTATAGHGDTNFSENTGERICDDYFYETNCYYYAPSTSGDICPSSWRIPPGADGSSIDANALAVPGSVMYLSDLIYDDEGAIRYPLNYVTSGYYYSNVQGGRGIAYGELLNMWWTSTIGMSDNGVDLIENNGFNGFSFGLNSASSESRIYGFPVRCVAQ